MKHKRPSFRGIGKASGAAIGALAVKIYECNGCGAQYPGQKPAQCRACSRMDFTAIDSREEAKRLGELRLLQHAGVISDLKTQVPIPLYAHQDGRPVLVGKLIVDFTYLRDGSTVYEDAKGGAMTDLAQWKIRHAAAQGIKVELATSKGRING